MDGRWDHPADSYPDPLFVALWIAVRAEAVKWIDENKPQHWARDLFGSP
jgi:hypothetical protein